MVKLGWDISRFTTYTILRTVFGHFTPVKKIITIFFFIFFFSNRDYKLSLKLRLLCYVGSRKRQKYLVNKLIFFLPKMLICVKNRKKRGFMVKSDWLVITEFFPHKYRGWLQASRTCGKIPVTLYGDGLHRVLHHFLKSNSNRFCS